MLQKKKISIGLEILQINSLYSRALHGGTIKLGSSTKAGALSLKTKLVIAHGEVLIAMCSAGLA